MLLFNINNLLLLNFKTVNSELVTYTQKHTATQRINSVIL